MAAIGILAAFLLCWIAPSLPASKTPVFVTASFLDKNRLYLENLGRDEIRIYENGQPREVEFLASKEVPVAYGLLFNRELLPKLFDDPRMDQTGIPSTTAAANMAYQLLDNALQHQVGWVGSYDSELRIALDFTQDSGRIKDVIQQLRGQRSSDEPSLYSAFFDALKKMSQRNEKRRVLVLLIDYLDMKTGNRLKPLKNLLSSSNVELFVAGFARSRIISTYGMPPAQSEASLRELAGVTAGGAYFAALEGIEGLGRRVSYQIRSFYTIGFQSESPPDEPGRLKIECTRAGTKVTTHPVVPILQ